MEKSRLELYVEELNTYILQNYENIKNIFNTEYGYPELDPLRDEICKCYICGLYQSTITLTNHLLEKSLKFCLGIKYSAENKKENIEIENAFIDGINKYDNFLLEQSINTACSQGLITKEQKESLKDFKNKFRNPYSHANKRIFNGKMVRGKQVSLKDLENGAENFFKLCFDNNLDKEIPIENLPFAQGLFQIVIAKEDCYPYFSEVDEIIRYMLTKLKPNR